MSENQGSVAVVTTKEQSFLDDSLKKALSPILKALRPASTKAVKVLEDILDDEKADVKLKASAAEKLLSFYMQTIKDINSDQVQRLIAELKLGPKGKMLIPVGQTPAQGEEPTPGKRKPIVDFTTIRSE